MILEKYNPIWTEHYMNIKREIEIAIYGIDHFFEHVGSTSVIHLDSKPIIDIDLIYRHIEDFEKVKIILENLGYYHNGNQGIQDRDVFKRSGKWQNEILDNIKHHLYVCPAGTGALERHILSRNFLRKNEWARLKYQEMKYDMAEKANQDRKIYAQLKEIHLNIFIDEIIAQEKTFCPES